MVLVCAHLRDIVLYTPTISRISRMTSQKNASRPLLFNSFVTHRKSQIISAHHPFPPSGSSRPPLLFQKLSGPSRARLRLLGKTQLMPYQTNIMWRIPLNVQLDDVPLDASQPVRHLELVHEQSLTLPNHDPDRGLGGERGVAHEIQVRGCEREAGRGGGRPAARAPAAELGDDDVGLRVWVVVH